MRDSISLLFLCILSFCACKKEKGPYVPITRCPDLTRNIDTINLYIQGTWDWMEEYRVTRYNGEEYITPNSPNSYHLNLKLSGDTARFFINNIPDSIYRFQIQLLSDFTNFPDDTLPTIAYYSFYTGLRKSQVPIMICENQLLMQHQNVSSIGGERLWIRK